MSFSSSSLNFSSSSVKGGNSKRRNELTGTISKDGDHLVREDSVFDHHAILVEKKSPDTGVVVHHTKNRGIVQEEVDLGTYQVETRPKKPDDVVQRAKERAEKATVERKQNKKIFGKNNNGYRLLTKNCEHFARECVYGEKSSSTQVNQIVSRTLHQAENEKKLNNAVNKGTLSRTETKNQYQTQTDTAFTGQAGSVMGAGVGLAVAGPIGMVVGAVAGGYAAQVASTRTNRRVSQVQRLHDDGSGYSSDGSW